MIFSVCAKTKRCLTFVLSEAGIDLNKCKIRDYKEFGDGEQSLILIGDGRKLRPILISLSLLNGESNFDWSYVN